MTLAPFCLSRQAIALHLLVLLPVGTGACGEIPPGRMPEVTVEVIEVSPVRVPRLPVGGVKRFEEGSELRFRVLTPVGGHLSIYLVPGGDGQPKRVHPRDSDAGKGMIAKNEPFEFPDAQATFKLEAAAPFGMEKLVAVVTAEALADDTGIPAVELILAQGECRYETYPGPPAALCPSLANNGDRTTLVLPLCVTFDTGSTMVSCESKLALLRVVADALSRPPLARMHLRIEGHADCIGSAAANLSLSKKRAESVAAVLRENGIAVGRMCVDGRGSYEPANEAETPEARRLNRRVELRIVDPAGLREDFVIPETQIR